MVGFTALYPPYVIAQTEVKSAFMRPQKANSAKDQPLSIAFRSCRGALASVGLFSCVINLLMLTGPLFMLQVYDRVLASGSVPTLVLLALLASGLFVFLGLFEALRSRITARMAKRVDEQVHAPLFTAVIEHSVRATPNMRAQPLRDLDTMRQFLSGPTPGTLFDLPWTPIFLAIIFLLHPYLGYFALGGAVLLAILALLNDLLTRGPVRRAGESSTQSHRLAEESRRNASVIQAMGMGAAMQERWHGIHARALHDQTQASDRNSAFTATAKALRLLMQSAILALGAYLAIHQEITAGTIIASSIIMARALAPIEQGISHWRGFLQFRVANQRLKLVLAEIEQRMAKMDLPAPKGRLSAEKLCVAAPGEAGLLLKDINFNLEPGQALGVIGPSGAGKSTLARALANVWRPASGTIAMDGAPFDQWDTGTLGRAVGYLPQDVELFEGTVDENIARFDPARDAKAVIHAARLAGVHDLILRLPDGYKTLIGEAGAKLSAGQRQRIGLARALYGSPALIILDEPNSNLDSVGEAALSHALLSEKKRGAAIVVIAHRPSAIAAMDALLYLSEGRQLLSGPKDEVLRKVVEGGNARSAPLRANAS